MFFLVDPSTQSLTAHDEGLYARRSRIIQESVNWFSPPFENPHHKTIGSYWLIALSIKYLGNSEISLRVSSFLSSVASLFIFYFISLKISNRSSSLIAIFSLSSMPLWIKYSRYASPDMLFVLSVLLIIFFFIKSLDSTSNTSKYLYIFLSGFFISVSFFVRSYMIMVPIIGLLPFISFNLWKSNFKCKFFFTFGLTAGSIPTLINLYYSFQTFGVKGITTLFSFAKNQSIGDSNLTNLFLIPLNFFYLTFPTGVILLILLILTKKRTVVRFPLLVYLYPFISLVILLLMSKSYPHYFLFLLPSFAILFSIHLQSFDFKYVSSPRMIRVLMLFLLALISIILITLLFNSNYLFEFIPNENLIIYFILLSFVISYLFIFRNIFYLDSKNILSKVFFNIAIIQYILISLLYNFGLIGSPNYKTVSFLRDPDISLISKENTIYLYNVDSKIETLLSYYLPSSKRVNAIDNIATSQYIITSDGSIAKNYIDRKVFTLLKEFDNNYLLIKNSY